MRPLEVSLCGDAWTMHCPDGTAVAACVPGCAHSDLQRAGIIPHTDALGGEAAQAWVGESVFSWRRTFRVGAALRAHSHVELVFQSIDTNAEVFIDGFLVCVVANNFHPHRIDLSQQIAATSLDHEFVLEVRCAAPVSEVKRLAEELGSRPVNGDWTPYIFLRKPACDFGWDWGPRAPSSGIVDLVFLHGWSGARIVSVRPLVTRCTPMEATIEFSIDTACDAKTGSWDASVEVESPLGERWQAVVQFERSGTSHCKLSIANPQRWWPRGYGAQHLYRVVVELSQRGRVAARWNGRVGLRSVSLDTTPVCDGTRFAIVVNEQEVWCAGANWIPDGLHCLEERRARVRERLVQACEAHLVMLRVWGGGGYESDLFFNQCDELGILVWQDFAFACAMYPEEPPFPALIEAEARFQLARLSPHPSLVLWCGGNEDILAWYSWGFRERLRAGQSWGRHYWVELLPRLCAELDPTRPYWTESPWSGSLDLHPNDSLRGDRHTWDASAKVEGFRSITPRFVSEFGHQSPPALQSLATALGVDATELGSLSASEGCARIASRQRATGGDDPQYGTHLTERFDPPADFAAWVAQAQCVQAKAMRVAYTWLRSSRPRCAGALVWQLNDAWTGHSWSLIDVHGRAKPSWHAVRDACAPRIIMIHPRDGQLVVEGVNDSPTPWRSRVRLQRFSLDAESCANECEGMGLIDEEFTIDPWSALQILAVPAPLIPDATCVLFAEAPTAIRSGPLAAAWYSSVHERGLKAGDGSQARLRAHLEWVSSPRPSCGSVAATVKIKAHTPLLDAVLVPRGDWSTVDRAFVSLPPNGEQRVEVVWRSDAQGIDLFAAGERIAQL